MDILPTENSHVEMHIITSIPALAFIQIISIWLSQLSFSSIWTPTHLCLSSWNGYVVYHNGLFGILIVQIIRGANKHQFRFTGCIWSLFSMPFVHMIFDMISNLIDTLPTLKRNLTDTWPILGRYWADTWPIVDRYTSVDISADKWPMYRSTIGQLSFDMSTDSRPIVGRQSTDSRPICRPGRPLVDMIRLD